MGINLGIMSDDRYRRPCSTHRPLVRSRGAFQGLTQGLTGLFVRGRYSTDVADVLLDRRFREKQSMSSRGTLLKINVPRTEHNNHERRKAVKYYQKFAFEAVQLVRYSNEDSTEALPLKSHHD